MIVYDLYCPSFEPRAEPYEGFWRTREQAEMAGEMSGFPYEIEEVKLLG